jgi:hypothetical protein
MNDKVQTPLRTLALKLLRSYFGRPKGIPQKELYFLAGLEIFKRQNEGFLYHPKMGGVRNVVVTSLVAGRIGAADTTQSGMNIVLEFADNKVRVGIGTMDSEPVFGKTRRKISDVFLEFDKILAKVKDDPTAFEYKYSRKPYPAVLAFQRELENERAEAIRTIGDATQKSSLWAPRQG